MLASLKKGGLWPAFHALIRGEATRLGTFRPFNRFEPAGIQYGEDDTMKLLKDEDKTMKLLKAIGCLAIVALIGGPFVPSSVNAQTMGEYGGVTSGGGGMSRGGGSEIGTSIGGTSIGGSSRGPSTAARGSMSYGGGATVIQEIPAEESGVAQGDGSGWRSTKRSGGRHGRGRAD
jgi:hypothetical protein